MTRRSRSRITRTEQVVFWLVHGLASPVAVGGLLTAVFLLAVVINASLNVGPF